MKALLGQSFRLAWINLEGEESAGSSFAHEPNDSPVMCLRGNGEHNVQMLMTTPEGKLINAVAGYTSEKVLLEELTFALELLKKTENQKRWEVRKFVSDAHRKRLDDVKQMDFDGVVGQIAQGRLNADRKYCRDHALIDATSFDTVDMVGNSTTFFGSSTGKSPKGRIGKGGMSGDLSDIIEKAKKRRKTKNGQRKERKGTVKI